jgi:hypothetical protein
MKWRTGLLGNLAFAKIVKKFPAFMKPKIHFHVYKNALQDPVPNILNLVHSLYFNIILLCTLVLPKQSQFSGFRPKFCMYFSLLACVILASSMSWSFIR